MSCTYHVMENGVCFGVWTFCACSEVEEKKNEKKKHEKKQQTTKPLRLKLPPPLSPPPIPPHPLPSYLPWKESTIKPVAQLPTECWLSWAMKWNSSGTFSWTLWVCLTLMSYIHIFIIFMVWVKLKGFGTISCPVQISICVQVCVCVFCFCSELEYVGVVY